MDLAPIPSPEQLTKFAGPSKQQRIDALKRGLDAAEKVLSRYPDYGKVSREYVAGIAELLADYPEDVLSTLCDKRIGISAVERFIPAPAAFVEYLEKLEAKRYATRDLRQGRVPEPVGSGQKPMPFPKLAAAFKDEPSLLQRNFECLCDASKALATQGREAAKTILMRGRTI